MMNNTQGEKYMELFKFCNAIMVSEYQTNSFRYIGYHTCPQCGARCDEDVMGKWQNSITHSEKWYEGNTKKEKGDSV